jgi:hypothetical protein
MSLGKVIASVPALCRCCHCIEELAVGPDHLSWKRNLTRGLGVVREAHTWRFLNANKHNSLACLAADPGQRGTCDAGYLNEPPLEVSSRWATVRAKGISLLDSESSPDLLLGDRPQSVTVNDTDWRRLLGRQSRGRHKEQNGEDWRHGAHGTPPESDMRLPSMVLGLVVGAGVLLWRLTAASSYGVYSGGGAQKATGVLSP